MKRYILIVFDTEKEGVFRMETASIVTLRRVLDNPEIIELYDEKVIERSN